MHGRKYRDRRNSARERDWLRMELDASGTVLSTGPLPPRRAAHQPFSLEAGDAPPPSPPPKKRRVGTRFVRWQEVLPQN